MNPDDATRGRMSPELRRIWVRLVLRCPELTAAHKTVLWALETYADYRDGRNARPGEANLTKDTGLKPRAIRYAIQRAQGHNDKCAPDCDFHLGLIEQTHPANSRAGRAAVYRLTIPAEIGGTTGTPMPVNNSTTGTTMPVNEPTTGTPTHHDRHAHDTTTGTSVPPTFQAPSLLKHPLLESDWGTSPERAAAAHTNSPPSRFCDDHPQGTRKRCPDCGNARTAFEAWQAASTVNDVAIAQAQDSDRRTRRQLIEACPDCDDFGRIPENPDADSWDTRLAPCDHPKIRRVDNAS